MIIVKITLGDTNSISDGVWSPNQMPGIAGHSLYISFELHICSMNWVWLGFTKSKMALIISHAIIILCTIRDKNAAKINSWHAINCNNGCHDPDFRGVKMWESIRPEQSVSDALEFRYTRLSIPALLITSWEAFVSWICGCWHEALHRVARKPDNIHQGMLEAPSLTCQMIMIMMRMSASHLLRQVWRTNPVMDRKGKYLWAIAECIYNIYYITARRANSFINPLF